MPLPPSPMRFEYKTAEEYDKAMTKWRQHNDHYLVAMLVLYAVFSCVFVVMIAAFFWVIH